jgi:hypothetical protein
LALQPQTLAVTAPQVWNCAVHAQLTLWPHAEMVPHASPALPVGHTGEVQQALFAHTWPLPHVETIVPPQPLGLPLSPQPVGWLGVQVQLPATLAVEPTHTSLVRPPAVEHGQVRLVLFGPSWKALSGPVEHGAPTAPVAP